MKIQILDKAKKKKIISELERFGMKKIPELLVRTGKERIRAYSGSLSKEEIMDIWKVLPIEGVGLYVGKETIDKNGVREVRLSVDGLHVWKEQIKDNVLVLSEEQEGEWFSGKNVELDGGAELAARGIPSRMGTSEKVPPLSGSFVAVESADEKDFIGMGKVGADSKVLYNFLPKERRRKSQTI